MRGQKIKKEVYSEITEYIHKVAGIEFESLDSKSSRAMLISEKDLIKKEVVSSLQGIARGLQNNGASQVR